MLFRPLWFVTAAASLHAASPQEEIAAKVPAARAVLDAWQAKEPQRAERKLHIVYWTPQDREPAPRYRERLDKIMQDIRRFYADEMERIGFGRRTVQLASGDDGLLTVHLVRGERPYSEYDVKSGGAIRSECLPVLRAAGIDAGKETIVIFCNMANWDAGKRTISQNSPYYAGGTSLSGTAWQVDSPVLDLEFLAVKDQNVSDGQYGDISLGRYNSIFIGGICHELGHALGLPHNRERAEEGAAFGTALMGSGNRTYGDQLRGEGKGSFLTLAHALRLASHPMFCGSVKSAELKPGAVPSVLTFEESGNGFRVTGTVAADPPVYGVVGYMDPDGGSDYDATTCTAVPDSSGNFTLDCNALAPGKKSELRIVFLQANGVASGFLSSTPWRYPYEVSADGKVALSAARQKAALLELKPAPGN